MCIVATYSAVNATTTRLLELTFERGINSLDQTELFETAQHFKVALGQIILAQPLGNECLKALIQSRRGAEEIHHSVWRAKLLVASTDTHIQYSFNDMISYLHSNIKCWVLNLMFFRP